VVKRRIFDITSTKWSKYIVYLCENMAQQQRLGISETVYDVYVTGIEGRAGMAAIVDAAHTVDLRQFNHDLQQRLPVYARPIFVRLVDRLDLTG